MTGMRVPQMAAAGTVLGRRSCIHATSLPRRASISRSSAGGSTASAACCGKVRGRHQSRVVEYEPLGALLRGQRCSVRSSTTPIEEAVFGTCATNDPRAVTLTSGAGFIWWVEALTHKTAETKAFYREFFGWTFVERAPLDPHPLYIVCMRGVEQAAGILPIGPGWNRDARWQVLFEVDDLQASTSAVLDAGGTIDFGPLAVPMPPSSPASTTPAARCSSWRSRTNARPDAHDAARSLQRRRDRHPHHDHGARAAASARHRLAGARDRSSRCFSPTC